MLACAFGSGVTASISCSVAGWADAMALMGLLGGASQSLALVGSVRRRLLWLPLTTLGVWLAFPVGYLVGAAGFILIGAPIAFIWPEAGRSQALMLVGFPVGGIAGGVVVGALQLPLVRNRADWLRRSSLGGVLLLPATVVAMYGPASQLFPKCDPWQPGVTIAAVAGGLAYGALTAAAVMRDGRSS